MGWLLILGAKSDIANALAHKFAKNGFNLYLAARGHEELDSYAKDITIRYGIEAQAVQFDALDYENHRKFYEALKEKPIGVICAVGYRGSPKKAEGDFEEAKKIIDTNFTGCVSILNIIAGDFERRKDGFIIGISSPAGERGRQSNYIYGSSKAGFSAYLSGLRNRLFRANVHVLTVKPGFVYTKMTEDLNLPPLLTETPEKAAEDIFKAWEGKKDVVYTGWFWKYIMFIIKIIPEFIFKRLRL